MKTVNIKFNKLKLLGALGISCLGYLAFISPHESVEAAKSVATHIGTFEGSTTFTTSSSNGINPGLFIEVMDDEGNLTQYESEEGIITIPNTKEGAYVTQAKLLGKTKYVDEETGEILDQFEEGRNLRLESVENPVLTTVGKNLFDGVSYIDGFIVAGNNYTVSYDTDVTSILVNVNKNTDYILSAKTNFDRSLVGGSLEPISIGTKTTNLNVERISNTIKFNSGEYTNIIIYLNSSKIDIEDIQVEEGSVSTTYEPYKTNILTTSEDVVLRGIGDVKDTLDCLTGEFVEKTKELELNTAYNVFSYNHSAIPDTHLGFSCDIENNEEFSTIGNYVNTTSNYDLNLLAWSSPNHIFGQINKSLLKSYDTAGLIDFFSNNEVSVIVMKAKSTVKTVDLTSTYFFKPINKDFIQVTGTVTPLVGSVTVPTNPILFTLDPNQEVGQQFIAPEFSISNDTMAPIRLTLNSFEQTTNVLTDVLPTTYENWEGLNKQESKNIALALVPKVSDRWLSLNEGPRYVAETSNNELGVIKAKSSVDFTFAAIHGRAFEETLNPSYRLGFVFEFMN